MPKRVFKIHLDQAAKVRRKSMFIDDSLQLPANMGIKDEHVQEPAKHMQYMKLNQNNEIERLLLHNSKLLLYHVDHCDFPSLNVGMWPQENNDLTNYPSCAFSTPRPLYVSEKQCEKVDICYKRSMSSDGFKKRMKHTRTSYLTALKSNKAIRSSIKDAIYHSSVFDMAERIYSQPDPFFHSSYDCYFTGGNLCALPCQRNVVHTGGEKLQDILLSEFSDVQQDRNTSSLNNIASYKNSEDCEIFEVCPLMTSPDCSRQNCFIVRQRNVVSINNINNDQQIKSVTQFRTKSTPFISVAQSKRDYNNLILTTMKQHIRLYDLATGVPALIKLFEISPKTPSISWNTVKPWRENTFMYANEKQFFMIDIRTSPEQWLSEVTSAIDDNMLCDHISAVLPSEFNNLFYVATNHKLHCLDIRNLKKYSFSDSDGAICRWSHQLRYPPLMMDTFRLRQTEYIALSSPIAGDLNICQLSRERNEKNIRLNTSGREPKHIYSSICLPYQPPTLLEAHEHARNSGKCLRPEANLQSRLKCCTTGMTFLSSSLNNLECKIGQLLTSNSNGDVFAHTLSKREKHDSEERCNRHSDEIMEDFEKTICKQTQPTLNYTKIKNMKGLRKVFLCKSLSSVNKFDLDAMENEYNENENSANNVTTPPNKSRPKRINLGRWQKSLSTLHSYKDALASDILSIWDIDIEEETNIRLGNLAHFKADPGVKVEDWLKKSFFQTPPMLSIPFQEVSRYTENDTSQVFNSSINIIQTQNTTIDFENAVTSTQLMDNGINSPNKLNTSDVVIQINNGKTTTMVEKLKTKKKNKKYIKGF